MIDESEFNQLKSGEDQRKYIFSKIEAAVKQEETTLLCQILNFSQKIKIKWYEENNH
jgi:hypothetical protein